MSVDLQGRKDMTITTKSGQCKVDLQTKNKSDVTVELLLTSISNMKFLQTEHTVLFVKVVSKQLC